MTVAGPTRRPPARRYGQAVSETHSLFAAGRLKRPWLIMFDVVAAAAILLATGGNLAAGGWETASGMPHSLAWVLALAVAVPIILRRVWPRVAFGLGLALSFLAVPFGGPVLALMPLVIAFPLYVLSANETRRNSLLALGIGLATAVLTNVLTPSLASLGSIAFATAALVVMWTLGRSSFERRVFAERTVEGYAQQAVAEERLRIAREMHDVVAHSMSLIAVKAAVGNHVAVEQPEEARDALRVIEATSRDALVEMRRMLGVLRSGSDDVTELVPAPTATDIRELADRAATAGIPVDIEVRGVDDLPKGVGLSVYRIVQEALTNVVKHAPSAKCRVKVVADGQEVRIEVVDDGHGEPVLFGTPGNGLIGMRERVLVYGGDFSAAPRPESGFRVFARLPYEVAS
jgi:signal transduction histidine kinase